MVWQVAPDLPIVSGDVALLHQMMAQLLDNARKFTCDCPQARIAISAPATADADDAGTIERLLHSRDRLQIALAFLVFGLLLSFTPCVLPMLPILSSILVGEEQVSRSRGLALAASYSMGMALVYTSLGWERVWPARAWRPRCKNPRCC